MLFNSLSFAIFFPVIFVLYWLLAKKELKFQNLLLLVASYYFYSCWDWRFSFLLLFSTLLDFFSGLIIAESKKLKLRKILYWSSISINLGILCVFKYYNFFVGSFEKAVAYLRFDINLWTLNILLPIGISFYTFHGISYVVDIYKERIEPERKFVNYAVFVSFFPLLVAGPIERATHLLPQIQKKRIFDYTKAIDGLRQILWGLFKKIVIADSCAEYVDLIFNNYSTASSSTLVFGGILFTVQLYSDFSGYSDIALGSARLLGIELIQNFKSPFISINITEFWRRWHISLSSWFNDYIFTPLVIQWRSLGVMGICSAVLITFFFAGLWHGANWTHVIYGLMHGVALVYEILTKKIRKKIYSYVPQFLVGILGNLFTLTYVMFSWIIFRSINIREAINYIDKVFSASFYKFPEVYTWYMILLIITFFFFEWLCRNKNHPLENFQKNLNRPLRWVSYTIFIVLILVFSSDTEPQFIYFQF